MSNQKFITAIFLGSALMHVGFVIGMETISENQAYWLNAQDEQSQILDKLEKQGESFTEVELDQEEYKYNDSEADHANDVTPAEISYLARATNTGSSAISSLLLAAGKGFRYIYDTAAGK